MRKTIGVAAASAALWLLWAGAALADGNPAASPSDFAPTTGGTFGTATTQLQAIVNSGAGLLSVVGVALGGLAIVAGAVYMKLFYNRNAHEQGKEIIGRAVGGLIIIAAAGFIVALALSIGGML